MFASVEMTGMNVRFGRNDKKSQSDSKKSEYLPLAVGRFQLIVVDIRPVELTCRAGEPSCVEIIHKSSACRDEHLRKIGSHGIVVLHIIIDYGFAMKHNIW